MCDEALPTGWVGRYVEGCSIGFDCLYSCWLEHALEDPLRVPRFGEETEGGKLLPTSKPSLRPANKYKGLPKPILKEGCEVVGNAVGKAAKGKSAAVVAGEVPSPKPLPKPRLWLPQKKKPERSRSRSQARPIAPPPQPELFVNESQLQQPGVSSISTIM